MVTDKKSFFETPIFFSLEYYCGQDFYKRPLANPDNNNKIIGWKIYTSKDVNIFRKQEYDWGMTYLSRKERTNVGEIEWTIDLNEVFVKSIKIDLSNYFTLYDGKVEAIMTFGEISQRISGNVIDMKNLRSTGEYLTINVNVSGGKGCVDWQHAQLFRTELEESKRTLLIDLEFY